MTEATGTIVTGTAGAIVTALGDGPCSALALSQRLANVTHANARQTLRRLAKVGVVTRLRRGLYGLCDNPQCDSTTIIIGQSAPGRSSRGVVTSAPVAGGAQPTPPFPSSRVYSEAEIDAAVLGAWVHFEAMNDIRNPEAWA